MRKEAAVVKWTPDVGDAVAHVLAPGGVVGTDRQILQGYGHARGLGVLASWSNATAGMVGF